MSTAIKSKGVERNTLFLCDSPYQEKGESDYDHASRALSLSVRIIYPFGETILSSCDFIVYVLKNNVNKGICGTPGSVF